MKLCVLALGANGVLGCRKCYKSGGECLSYNINGNDKVLWKGKFLKNVL